MLHQTVLHAAASVRQSILKAHGRRVLPECYTMRCTCDFLNYRRGEIPKSVLQTAIYRYDDGVVDWHYWLTGNAEIDFEVPGTHIGLVFNASAYRVIADRLAEAIGESGD